MEFFQCIFSDLNLHSIATISNDLILLLVGYLPTHFKGDEKPKTKPLEIEILLWG